MTAWLVRRAADAGERVIVRARPHRDPSLHAAFAQELIKQDGTILSAIFTQSTSVDSVPVAQHLWGVWRVVAARGRGFGGPNLSLPLTEKGRAAAARYDARDDPMTECVPQTTPASISNEYLHALEQDGENVLLRDEYWEVVRTVHMDGRAHPPADQRFQQGHSTGYWEGDTLVVETTNFIDKPCLTEPIVDSEKWRYMPNLELLSNKCGLEVAHRYLRRD